jgi:hypothetical protein
MAYFDSKKGIVLEPNDLKGETPDLIKNFWGFILTGNPQDTSNNIPNCKSHF